MSDATQQPSKDMSFRDALMHIRERAYRLAKINCPDTCSEWEHPLCWIARTADAALRTSHEPFPVHLHGVPRDRPVWICSVCNGWNHVQDNFCTHTHPANADGGSPVNMLVSSAPPPERGLAIAAQAVLDAYQSRFETGTGNYFGPIDDEVAALRIAMERLSQPPGAWQAVMLSRPTEADGDVVLVFTGDAYSVEYPADVNGAEHIAWHRITPYTRPTKRPGRCPHGYELANLDDGTDTCSGCSGSGEESAP